MLYIGHSGDPEADDALAETTASGGNVVVTGAATFGSTLITEDDGTLDSALFMEPWTMMPFLNGFAVTDTDAHVVRYFDDKGVFTAVGSGEAGYTDGTFGPDAPVTREQLVTILYRYAVAMEHDVSVGEETNILSYIDVFSIGEYAFPAMQWACGAGIVNGYEDGSLKPADHATRAQMVKILMTAMQVFEL